MKHSSFPAALLRASGLIDVRAQASQKPAGLDAVISAFEEFKTKHESRYSAIESQLDDLCVKAASQRLNGGGSGPLYASDPDYSSSFKKYFIAGTGEEAIRGEQTNGTRGNILASWQSGSGTDGGYLAPVEWDRKVSQAQRAKSPLRRLCDVRQTTVGEFSSLWKMTGPGSGWVGETASRPTTSTPTFETLLFGHGELYANPAITQRLLDDAQFDAEDWLATEVSNEFDVQESIAFLSGNGTNKPFGLLGYVTGGAHADRHPGGSIAADPSGHASQLTADGLVDFTYKLPAPYRQGAAWLMNSATAAVIAKMKDGQGNFLWRESMAVGQPATLLGRPVEIDEGMPSIAANALPILLGDFRAGYVICDRSGVKVLRDPFTNKPFVHFYTTKRVGGGVKDPNALRALKVAAS